MNWPTKDTEYVPDFVPKPEPLTIEYVREHGKIVAVSEDRTKATVEVRQGLVLSYLAVSLDKDGKVVDFLRKHINRYVKAAPK